MNIVDRDAWRVREAIYRYLATRGRDSAGDLLGLLSDSYRDKSAVELALEYIRLGGDPERVSELLSWRDFEYFVLRAMELSGMHVSRGVRAPPPRGFEIDVVGVDTASRLAIAVDCKHWSRSSGLSRVARDMEDRISRALSRCDTILRKAPELRIARDVYASIVLLREPPTRVIGRIFIVPVYRLRDFLQNLRKYAEELGIEPYRNPCHSQRPVDSYTENWG